MTKTQPAGGLILSESRPLRLFTLFILYVTQGVPIGLFWFAIPAWMAANGSAAEDVAYVLGFTALPWTLKLVNGFVMDRYTFLKMGRRRVWIIGAQLVMIACLIACALINPSSSDVVLLAAAGFIVNSATTFQDVAVDGLAVDIMEEDERARGSGMMFGGQAIGSAIATAATGTVISIWGSGAAYLLSAVFIGVITIYMGALRERGGESRLPWTSGNAHPVNLAVQADAWWPILKATTISLFTPVSLFWMINLLGRGFHYGVFTGTTPLIGTGSTGWDEAQITSLIGTGGLIGGIAGLTIGGFFGDRMGAKWSTAAMLLIFAVIDLTMFFGTELWGDEQFYIGFVIGWLVCDTLITVVALPISMRLCDPKVAATQFTIYMATANFGISMGAWALGFTDAIGGLANFFLVVLAFHAVSFAIVVLVKFPRSKARQAKATAVLASANGPAPVID